MPDHHVSPYLTQLFHEIDSVSQGMAATAKDDPDVRHDPVETAAQDGLLAGVALGLELASRQPMAAAIVITELGQHDQDGTMLGAAAGMADRIGQGYDAVHAQQGDRRN